MRWRSDFRPGKGASRWPTLRWRHLTDRRRAARSCASAPANRSIDAVPTSGGSSTGTSCASEASRCSVRHRRSCWRPSRASSSSRPSARTSPRGTTWPSGPEAGSGRPTSSCCCAARCGRRRTATSCPSPLPAAGRSRRFPSGRTSSPAPSPGVRPPRRHRTRRLTPRSGGSWRTCGSGSSRAIARALVPSERTVVRHLIRIFDELAAGSYAGRSLLEGAAVPAA